MVKIKKELRESYKTSDLVADIKRSLKWLGCLITMDETGVCKILFKVLQMIEESYEAQTELAGR
jgi:hypothetical protein